jgi:polyisoprenoid-binding protein YceI
VARCPLRIRPLLVYLALCAAALPPDAVSAPPEVMTFDSARSFAEFQVHVMWLFPVHGRFGTLQGTISIDRLHATAKVDARIDVNDVHMRSTGNEAWVRSAEFFDAEHFPQIQFVSESFPLALLKSGGTVNGVLTIRGTTRRARFELAESDCPDAIARTCPVEAAGTLRRSDFGMRSRRGALSDKVQLDLSVYVLPAADATP